MKHNQSTALVRLVSSSLRLSLALGVVGVFASVGSAASTAKDTYYVNDHLATTVATSDAAGEIAQIEADAFGTQASPVTKDSRFTGKPYDADMGAYVFPFRNYRSDEARWMSADPSGFPDGNNSRFYAPNPIAGFDALGLAVSYGITMITPSSDYTLAPGSRTVTATSTASVVSTWTGTAFASATTMYYDVKVGFYGTGISGKFTVSWVVPASVTTFSSTQSAFVNGNLGEGNYQSGGQVFANGGTTALVTATPLSFNVKRE